MFREKRCSRSYTLRQGVNEILHLVVTLLDKSEYEWATDTSPPKNSECAFRENRYNEGQNLLRGLNKLSIH